MTDFFLADDLSGALDAAGAFHRAGRRVRVMLSAEMWEPSPEDDVIGITTETRNASPAQAAVVVRRAIEQANARGARLIYKKIDSTLRGPVAAELAALAAALPDIRVLFVSANPAVGRTVREGVLRVRGVPVAETEFARDPVWPVRESDVRRLLGEAATASVVIADAETEADLDRAVAAMDAAGKPWVGVGSGALARPVAARAARQRGPGSVDPKRPPDGPTLMIGGSAHALNREQAAELARQREVPRYELELTAPARALNAAIETLAQGPGVSVEIEERRGDSTKVVATVATVAAEIMKRSGVRRVFVTGGETAFALCRELCLNRLTFLREIEPGLSVSSAEGEGETFWFAVKPGGFGDRETWVRAWDALRDFEAGRSSL